ncbi:hypothetical protein ACJROX_06320 [Pseudalkalibacillus sp. A8]|uniref:hypothetical protein n=1 Tax=Pseudalkalibacillus sp. A8 TaxID=3382641 RepID=UPI0038B5268D
MSIQLAIFLSTVLMGMVAFITYYVGKRGSNRLIKYIPAIAAAGISFFSIKLNFYPYESHAFEGIL